jgi:rod shape-determining protein MreD
MLAGSAAGLIQDALSSGVVGIGGLAKTIVGFLAGAFGQQFIVTAALPRLVIFMAGTVLHGGVFMGLYYLLGLRAFPSPWKPLLAQALGNALVGIVAFGVIESLPGMVERRRVRRGRR